MIHDVTVLFLDVLLLFLERSICYQPASDAHKLLPLRYGHHHCYLFVAKRQQVKKRNSEFFDNLPRNNSL